MNPLVRWFHQLGSPPTFDRFAARWAPWAYALGLLLMAWGLYGALFLSQFPDGWKVVAAGCIPQPGRPYQCTVEGG